MTELLGVAHVGLTVTDLDRSRAWYEDILGWQFLFDGEDERTRFVVGIIAPSNIVLGLRQHRAGTGDTFDPGRTGLDHVAFSVGSRADLDTWQQRLVEKGVTYTPTIDAPYGHVLNFKDPDNIALELFSLPAG
ncbi:MAG: VOC family protein [Actinomycetota bacterium]